MKKGIKSHMQLPKLILKNFRGEADPEKKVWYMDLNTGKIRRSSPARLGTEIGYYSQEGEEFWNRYVETSLGKLVKKTKAFCDGEMDALIIDQDDAEAAKLYIKSAFIRSRATYEAVLRNSYTGKTFQLTLKGTLSHTIELGSDIHGNIQRMENVLEAFPARLNACEQALANLHIQIENAKAEVEKPFMQEDELKTKSARLAELDSMLNMDKRENDTLDAVPEQEEKEHVRRYDRER